MFRYQGTAVKNEKGKVMEVIGNVDAENRNIGVNRNQLPKELFRMEEEITDKGNLAKAQGKCSEYRGNVSRTIGGYTC
jgi:hypothetical protein